MLPALFFAAALSFGPEHLSQVLDAEDPLVDAQRVVPGLIVQLVYSTKDNIAGRPLYPEGTPCLLRRSVAERLLQAQTSLGKEGLRLIAWDCTRSLAAQEALWKAHPQPGSVADPARGSLHARGVAVDLSLADASGRAVQMPTAFDAFGPAAAARAELPEGPARRHRDLLEQALHAAGFRVNPREWWHYSRLYGWRWPVAREALGGGGPQR